MKTVMCFGTFDLLHLGHVDYFRQARTYGQRLIVVVARDKTKDRQGKIITFSEVERVALLEQLKIVDRVVLGDKQDYFKVILDVQPDVLCLGYDHPVNLEALQRHLGEQGLSCQVIRARAYEPHRQKSSILREAVLRQ